MKKIFTLTALAAASILIASQTNAQVYIHAHVGFPFHGPRVYMAPPPVVYQEPAPVYQEPYPVEQEACTDPNGYPSDDGVVYEGQFPGYAYYDYPAWNGHYRDYYYYAHYRPFFQRRYTGYFNGGRFDRERFQRENYGRGYANGGYGRSSYHGSGYANGGYHGGAERGAFGNHGGGNHGGGYNHGRR